MKIRLYIELWYYLSKYIFSILFNALKKIEKQGVQIKYKQMAHNQSHTISLTQF